jgi:hypothetical protein
LGVVPAHTFQVGPQVRYMIGAIISTCRRHQSFISRRLGQLARFFG